MNLQFFRNKIIEKFNLAEINDLCFELNIQHDNVPGSTRDEKARELVEYCNRHGLLPSLLKKCTHLRPNESWQEAAESNQQLAPEIREDKLSFLCWVYIKFNGNISQRVNSDDVANALGLDELKTVRIAQFLNKKDLLKFKNWNEGIGITHLGIVKVEHDIIKSGFVLNKFPPDIFAKIEKIKKIRSRYLHCLYKKSNGSPFESISGIEIANEINMEHHELVDLGVNDYLAAEGWLLFRAPPNVQITEEGIENVESGIV